MLRSVLTPSARVATSRNTSPRTTNVRVPRSRIFSARPEASRPAISIRSSLAPTAVRGSALSAARSGAVRVSNVQSTCAAAGRSLVGGAGEIGRSDAAPDRRGAARVTAAVGVEDRERGPLREPEHLAGGPLHGRLHDGRPARRPQPGGLVQLAMSGGAEVEPIFRVAAAVRRRIGPRDHRLDLEHPLGKTVVVAVGVDLRQRRGGDVVLERDLTHDQSRCPRAPARESFSARPSSRRPTEPSRARARRRIPLPSAGTKYPAPCSTRSTFSTR